MSHRRIQPSGPLFAQTRLLAALVLALGISACTEPIPNATADAGAEGEYDLAPLMGHLQRHTDKLGYSIEAQNAPLAGFYVEELVEMLERVEAIDTHDGISIGKPTEVMMRGPVAEVEGALSTGDWGAVSEAYAGLVSACNRCHVATQHGFIEILPASGPPPYNQRF